MIPGIYITNTTFEMAVASAKNGGVFFVTRPPKEMIIKDSCFKDCEGKNGTITYRFGAEYEGTTDGMQFTKFAMTNTIVDGCTVRDSPGYLLDIHIKDGGTCDFSNNTFRGLRANTFRVTGVNYQDEIVLSDWTFEDMASGNFILNLGTQPVGKVKLVRCVLKGVTCDDYFNGYAGSRFGDITFDRCTIDGVSVNYKTYWMDLWSGSKLKLQGCTFQGQCNGIVALFRAVGSAVEIKDCVFQNLNGMDKVFMCYVYQGNTASVIIDNCTVSGGTVMLGEFEVDKVTFDKLDGNAVESNGIEDDPLVVLSVQQESSIGLSTAGTFKDMKVTSYYFTGGSFKVVSGTFETTSETVPDIKARSSVTLMLDRYVCFDRAQDQALSLEEGVKLTYDSDSIYVCDPANIPTRPPPTPTPETSSSGEIDESGTHNPDTGGGPEGGTGGNGGLSKGAAAAIAVVVILVVVAVIVVLVIFFVIRRRKDDTPEDMNGAEMNEESQETRTSFDASEIMPAPTLDDLSIDLDGDEEEEYR